jgi:hypothetical protein
MTIRKMNIYQRIHAVMTDVHYVQKDTKVDMGKGSYKAVSHDAVTAKIREAMVRHGLIAYIAEMSTKDDELEFEGKYGKRQETRTKIEGLVRFRNIDDPSEMFDVRSVGYGLDSGDKGPGKATSYMFKYALLKTFMLETGEDSDKEASKPRAVDVPKTTMEGYTTTEKKKMFEALQKINTERAETLKKTPGKWDEATWDSVREVIESNFKG